jgi:Tfp pilus assembly protein PilZ
MQEDANQFDELLDLKVKDYANVLESYMAALFLDSGNLI